MCSLQEEIQPSVNDTLRVYRASNLLPFFVMYEDSDCSSPSFALINQDTVWNNRSLSCYLQASSTTQQYGTELCPKRNCPCPKTSAKVRQETHISNCC